jgi:O-methyltransferase
MTPGGVVVYDDYGFSACEGITRRVNDQIDQTDRIVVHNLNGHAVVVKLAQSVETGKVPLKAKAATP